MNPSYAYSALIDVLAYRQRLSQDQKSGLYTFREDLEEALRCFDQINSAVFGVQAISDTVLLTCTSHGDLVEFLGVVKSVFLRFLDRGLYIRGGLAYSKHFQNGRLTYSHAIARAYELESTSAIYPRIVIDENIVQMHSVEGAKVKLAGERLIVQQNGVYFIHILDDANWAAVYEAAKRAYTRDKEAMLLSEAALSKHAWFERYLSTFLPSGEVFSPYIELAQLY